MRAAVEPGGPGCAAVAVRDGVLTYAGGAGLADLAHDVLIDSTTVFQAGSLAKQVTAFAVLLLVADGRLSLDDDVRRHLAELRVLETAITVRQLLNHTAGLRDEWDLLQFAGWRAGDVVTSADGWTLVTRQRGLNFKPGTEHLYSNSGYDALARVVAVVAGVPFPDFVRDRVFGPLAMTRSRMEVDHTAIIPGGAVGYLPRYEGGWAAIHSTSDVVGPTNFLTTAGDLGRWLKNLLDGAVGGQPVRDEMLRRARLVSGDSVAYGMGLTLGRYRGARMAAHGGAERGFQAEMFLLPEHRFASGVLCNRWRVNPATIVRRIADIHLEEHLAPRPVAPPSAPPTSAIHLPTLELRKFAGTYREIGGLRVRPIAFVDTGLVWSAANWHLVPVESNRFRVVGEPVELEFRRNPQGQTLRMLLLINGQPSGEFEQMPPFQFSGAGLAAFSGRFASTELDVEYQVSAADSVVVIRGPHGLEMMGRPAYRDAFILSIGSAIVRFTRDRAGNVDGFTLSTERVRALPFVRRR